jgi:shikimate dehydrogenase
MRRFGLIGYPLTHSFSRTYFTEIFRREGIDAIYENYPIPDIAAFPELLRTQCPEGLNVTIPYKEAVLPFLDEWSDAVQEIGACNCITLRGGVLKGYNTDVTGFELSLRKYLDPCHTKALVLGTGGASKAVCHVLRRMHIPLARVSRDPAAGDLTYAALTAAIVADHPLIINTTPLGMYPNVDECPDLPYAGVGKGHYLFDLVYNPEKTNFLSRGEERGAVISNGYDMLRIQADESRKIWNV